MLKIKILRTIHRLFPFTLRGDLSASLGHGEPRRISCLICASTRPQELASLLDDLCRQDLGPHALEIVIVNDGGGPAVRDIIDLYKTKLPITSREHSVPNRNIGFLRNLTAELSGGEYLLFLDDDTRLPQKDFLRQIIRAFQETDAEVILPHAYALYGIVKQRCDYLDEYSFANRCCCHRRELVDRMGGFRNINSYEDVELGIRLSIAGARITQYPDLYYLHPPLFFTSLQKPLAAGQAVLGLQKYYPIVLWLLIYLHASRFLFYAFWPFPQHRRQWFKLSLGIFLAPFCRREYHYA